MIPFRNEKGLTLVELIVGAVLIGVVLMGATQVHLTSFKFMNAMKANKNHVSAHLALEIISREVYLANDVKVGTAANPNDKSRLRIRWDYTLRSFQPNGTVGTTLDTTDDTFVKYAIINGRLYWRNDPVTDNRDVVITDAGTSELMPDLNLMPGSQFEIIPGIAGVGGTNVPNSVRITLLVQTGYPPKTITLSTDVNDHATSTT